MMRKLSFLATSPIADIGRPVRWIVIAGALWMAATAGTTQAQARKQEEDVETPPEPTKVLLATSDGRQVPIQYYGSLGGKKAVPVIIVPGWGEEAADYEDLALYLQTKKGHAVVVPDLRGHGDNKTVEIDGKIITLNLDRFRDRDIDAMITKDMEAVKRFLVKKNNAGELNVEKLCVVGIEFGALLAMNWATVDWGWPILPSFKQGQDVKALVLISPEKSRRGLKVQYALDDKEVARKLSYQIIYGQKQDRMAKTAKFIHGRLKKHHPKPPPEDRKKHQTLFDVGRDTNLQGAKLLNEKDFKVKLYIASFINARLVKKTFPWTKRVRP